MTAALSICANITHHKAKGQQDHGQRTRLISRCHGSYQDSREVHCRRASTVHPDVSLFLLRGNLQAQRMVRATTQSSGLTRSPSTPMTSFTPGLLRGCWTRFESSIRSTLKPATAKTTIISGSPRTLAPQAESAHRGGHGAHASVREHVQVQGQFATRVPQQVRQLHARLHGRRLTLDAQKRCPCYASWTATAKPPVDTPIPTLAG